MKHILEVMLLVLHKSNDFENNDYDHTTVYSRSIFAIQPIAHFTIYCGSYFYPRVILTHAMYSVFTYCSYTCMMFLCMHDVLIALEL